MVDCNNNSGLIPYEDPLKRNNSNEDQIDLREQLVNGGLVGPIKTVQLSEDGITTVLGIMIDVDPSLLNSKSFGLESFGSPSDFYTRAIRPMLNRHPTLAKAHVRCSGNGLHVILFFDTPVAICSEAARELWAGISEAVQSLLPSDPRCPGLTAVTRPLGSINSKNNTKVFELVPGGKVSAQEVETLCQELACHPFKTVATILFGPGPITQCPVCKKSENRLGVMDRVGCCYECGDVEVETLYDHFFKPLQRKEG